jgi:hypothetical protein
MTKQADKIKWKSALFPMLILTEDHFQVMRRIYPYIDSFQREMERLEGWLYVNPQRVPKKNWKNQINNWMKIADKIAQRERQQRLVRGQERPVSHREAAESIGSILERLAAENSPEGSATSAPTSLFDALGRPLAGQEAK